MTQWAIISLGCPSTLRSVFMFRNYWSILFWYGFKQNDWLSDLTNAVLWKLLRKVAGFLNRVLQLEIYTRYFTDLIFVYVCVRLSTDKNYWFNRFWFFSLNLEWEKHVSCLLVMRNLLPVHLYQQLWTWSSKSSLDLIALRSVSAVKKLQCSTWFHMRRIRCALGFTLLC